MKKEIENQQENIKELIKLATENPNLRIVPMVDSEIVADEGHSFWSGRWGSARIDEVYISDERIYFKLQDIEDLVEDYIDEYDGFFNLDEEILLWAEEKINNLPWEKVIVVYITTP